MTSGGASRPSENIYRGAGLSYIEPPSLDRPGSLGQASRLLRGLSLSHGVIKSRLNFSAEIALFNLDVRDFCSPLVLSLPPSAKVSKIIRNFALKAYFICK